MKTTIDKEPAAESRSAREPANSSWSRDIRLASGMVLLLFATTHFLNHAVGIAGLEVMERVQAWRHGLWHSWMGTAVLYGAFIVHPLFALLRVAQRRTFRMPAREALQILLGFAIPFFLIDHIAGTRIAGVSFGLDERYHAVLQRIWPSLAIEQSVLLLLVWTHGIIGLHFLLRTRATYPRWREPFLLAAILLPILALIGFAVAGREAALLAGNRSADLATAFAENVIWAKSAYFGLVASFALFVAIREIRVRTTSSITVRFVGHGLRKLTPGLTVLEMFRRFDIPHAALCGGRARCATCRVLVLDGGDKLPLPASNEAKLLRRISAPSGVRLACQIRPRDDLQVRILLASRLGDGSTTKSEAEGNSEKRALTVMVGNLHALTALSERQLPQELMGLLNRLFDEIVQAVAAHGGRIDEFNGHGFTAVFGLESGGAETVRAAIKAASDIVRAVEALNREFGPALPLPLRIGLGIHSGEAIAGTVESEGMGRRGITVGEPVMVASQLQAATRRVLCDIIVSDATMRLARRRDDNAKALRISITGWHSALAAHGFGSATELAAVLREDDALPSSPVESTRDATGISVDPALKRDDHVAV
jgi:adenylate cyclase